MIAGDEIRLRHPAPNIGVPPWTGTGIIVRAGSAVRVTDNDSMEPYP